MDALILARMQFAANITFHILFPTISIALGWLLLFFRWRWLRTKDGPDAASAPVGTTPSSLPPSPSPSRCRWPMCSWARPGW
jgi:hypothetical protein